MYYPDTNWEHLLSHLKWEESPLPNLFAADTWVLSFSGGADSVLSAYFLKAAQSISPTPRTLIFYHLNHYGSTPIPPARAAVLEQWTQWFRESPELNFELKLRQKDVGKIASKAKMSFERTGSLLRQKDKRSTLRCRNAIFVTGHNLSDWYETIWMRLNRGVAPNRLIPFPIFSERTFRPLYNITRDEVRNMLRELSLNWWDDPDDLAQKNLRAKVRKLPVFNSSGLRISARNFREHFSAESELFRQDFKTKLITIIPGREYRIKREHLESLSTDAQILMKEWILAKLGLGALSASLRKRVSRLPFQYGPWVIESEVNRGESFIVARRGNPLRPQYTPQPSQVRADQITKKSRIRLSIGHKSVKKILSEHKLSGRQRRNLYLDYKDSVETIVRVPLSVFGLKDIQSLK